MAWQERIHNAGLAVLLFGAWFVFSGFTETSFLVMGGLSTLATLYLCRRMGLLEGFFTSFAAAFRLPVYGLWLAKEIALSAWQVTRKVWIPKERVLPMLAWVPTRQEGEAAIAAFANSITLTPGTVSVAAERGRILVHALEESGIGDLRSGRMDGKVRWLMQGGRA